MHLGDLTLESAKALQGTKFEVTLPDGTTTTMTLDEALPFDVKQRRRARASVTPKREAFALYFLGTPSMIVPQGTYPFRSEAVTFDQLFIVPIGQDEEATEYEACFT
jgi:hypothetical protein